MDEIKIIEQRKLRERFAKTLREYADGTLYDEAWKEYLAQKQAEEKVLSLQEKLGKKNVLFRGCYMGMQILYWPIMKKPRLMGILFLILGGLLVVYMAKAGFLVKSGDFVPEAYMWVLHVEAFILCWLIVPLLSYGIFFDYVVWALAIAFHLAVMFLTIIFFLLTGHALAVLFCIVFWGGISCVFQRLFNPLERFKNEAR